MTGQNLNLWLKVFREAGVTFSCEPESIGSILDGARKYQLEFDANDVAALEALEIHLGRARPANPTFNPAVTFHPEVFVPERRTVDVKNASGPSAPLPKPAALHPWGRMEERLEAGMKALIPIDWRETDWASPKDPFPRNTKVWREWVADIAKEISTKLWPAYDPQDPNCWDIPLVRDLLEADFSVLSVLRENFELPIDSRYPTQVLHSTRFVEEDDGKTPFGSNYILYDPELSSEFYSELPVIFTSGMADKVGTLDLRLKQLFQRPRAYQVALLQNRRDFSYQWARTGNTPSMVSGHCLQASMGGCTSWVELRSKLNEAGADEVFQQFVVDVGDRRVFAGVHYPSDNLASWYTAMRLIPRVFLDGDKASGPRKFLWNSIQRSLVYKAIVAHEGPKGKVSPYKAMLTAIEALAGAGG